MTAANTRELVEVVARFGDTILDVKLVAAGGTYRLGEAELVAVPGIARVGLVDVTLSPVSRPVRSVPYLAASMAAHVVICVLAIAKPVGVGGAAVAVTDHPINAPRLGWHVGPAAGAAPAIAMALEVGPKRPKRDPRRMRAIADAETPGMTDDDARDRIAALVSSMDASSSYDKIDTTGGGGGGDGGEGGGFGGTRGGSVGTGGGVVGDGRYATNVAGRGAGGDWVSAGKGEGGLRGRESRGPTVILCGGPAPCVAAVGDLDKAIIRRYLRRQLPKILYCYEKQLLVDGTIAGNVATQFVIGADGKVVEATSQGMNEPVAECVANVIRSIEFPRSKTRTSTRVTYPFSFRTH